MCDLLGDNRKATARTTFAYYDGDRIEFFE
jgi:hypothetical protein